MICCLCLSFVALLPPSLSDSAVVVPDGASDKVGLGDELGSEEDLLYEEFRSSGHRFGHPGGGGGEQLAINEVGNVEMLSLTLHDGFHRDCGLKHCVWPKRSVLWLKIKRATCMVI